MNIKPLILAAMLATLGGCAAINPPAAYTSADIARAQTVTFGRVVAVNPAKIRVQSNGNVTRAGEQAGTAIGSTSSRNSQTNNAAGAIGQAIGGILAANAEIAMNTVDGLSITVRLDDGRTLAVLQPAKPPFEVGQRIAVGEFGGQARVIDARTLTSSRPDLTPRSTRVEREVSRRTTQARASEAKGEAPKATKKESCAAMTVSGKSYKRCGTNSQPPATAQMVLVDCRKASASTGQTCSKKPMKTTYVYLVPAG